MEENRQLRAGMGLTASPSRPTEQKDEQREKDRAREKENEELRQRINTLDTGWQAVMKALAASGLPLNVPSAPSSSSVYELLARWSPMSAYPHGCGRSLWPLGQTWP